MINYHKELVKALKSITPEVHYEMILKKGTKVPCISYMELSNMIQTQTDATDVSVLRYQIKVWSNKIEDLQIYAGHIDNTLRPLGWKRVASIELYDTNSTMMQKVLTYEALALEKY